MLKSALGADEKVLGAAFEHLERRVAPILLALARKWPEADLRVIMTTEADEPQCGFTISRYHEGTVMFSISPKGVISGVSSSEGKKEANEVIRVARKAIH